MPRQANPELIKQIQDIVAEELQKKSIEEITMRYIAERAGITATTIYYYFKSKNELIDQIKFSATAELSDYILKAIEGNISGNFFDLIDTGVRTFIEWLIGHPILADLIFEKLPPKLDMEESEMLKTLYQGPLKIMDIINKGIQGGELADRDYTTDVTILIGTIYGVVKMNLNKRTFPKYWNDFEPLTEKILDIARIMFSQ